MAEFPQQFTHIRTASGENRVYLIAGCMFTIVFVHSMAALEVAYLQLLRASSFLAFPCRMWQAPVACADNMDIRVTFIIPIAIALVRKNLTNFHTADTLGLRYCSRQCLAVVTLALQWAAGFVLLYERAV
jgi:hypothetical protein